MTIAKSSVTILYIVCVFLWTKWKWFGEAILTNVFQVSFVMIQWWEHYSRVAETRTLLKIWLPEQR